MEGWVNSDKIRRAGRKWRRKEGDLRRSQRHRRGTGHTQARNDRYRYVVSSFRLLDLCRLERRRCRLYSILSPSFGPDQRNLLGISYKAGTSKDGFWGKGRQRSPQKAHLKEPNRDLRWYWKGGAQRDSWDPRWVPLPKADREMGPPQEERGATVRLTESEGTRGERKGERRVG